MSQGPEATGIGSLFLASALGKEALALQLRKVQAEPSALVKTAALKAGEQRNFFNRT